MSNISTSYRPRKHGPKIVAIGGGHGLSNILRGLKLYSENITAIVTVADDGGGSGVLRQDLGMPWQKLYTTTSLFLENCVLRKMLKFLRTYLF